MHCIDGLSPSGMHPELGRWFDSVSGPEWVWYLKILSGNDTLANKAHQAGPYVPKQIAFQLFPSLLLATEPNPRVRFSARVDSHSQERQVDIIWYNHRASVARPRNECRITNWGGKSSPVLDADATGSPCIFAFRQRAGADAVECRVWVRRRELSDDEATAEADAIQDIVGPLEPGVSVLYSPSQAISVSSAKEQADSACTLDPGAIPPAWLFDFPRAEEIVAKSVESLRSVRKLDPDLRLTKRRLCEYEIFRSIEKAVVLPRIGEGFATVDIFVDFANSVTNRRKSRSGRSLELQARTIFDEEGLQYDYGAVSENRKAPDFLFPSARAYHDPSFPSDRLRMLAVKTTCKDRWRQILNEADRVPYKHLLTLQEGIGPNQYAEMKRANVTLVVPRSLQERYSRELRGELVSLADFIRTTRSECEGFR